MTRTLEETRSHVEGLLQQTRDARREWIDAKRAWDTMDAVKHADLVRQQKMAGVETETTKLKRLDAAVEKAEQEYQAALLMAAYPMAAR